MYHTRKRFSKQCLRVPRAAGALSQSAKRSVWREKDRPVLGSGGWGVGCGGKGVRDLGAGVRDRGVGFGCCRHRL